VNQSLPNPTTGAGGRPYHGSTYDLDGDLLSQTDPLGNVIAYSYDPFGNEVSRACRIRPMAHRTRKALRPPSPTMR